MKGELCGNVIDNDFLVEDFIVRQYDAIDIYVGTQVSNGEGVYIRVFNKKYCKNFIDLEAMWTTYKVIINFHSPYVNKCISMDQNDK